MHTTVPSSAQACQNGSQWSEWMLGQPELRRGSREKVTAWQPFAASAAHLGGQ